MNRELITFHPAELQLHIGDKSANKELKNYNLAELLVHFRKNPDWKGDDDITVSVKGVLYCIPNYCLTGVLWGMPDDFYPCDKYEWADHPVYFTSIDMVKTAILADEAKFKAFIMYSKTDKNEKSKNESSKRDSIASVGVDD